MKRAQNVAQAVVKTRSSLSSWSCMGARRRAVAVGSLSNTKEEDMPETSLITRQSRSRSRSPDSPVSEVINRDPEADDVGLSSSSGGSEHDDTDEEEVHLSANRVINDSNMEDITEGELWYELEMELQREENGADAQAQQEEEAAAAKEIIGEEEELADSLNNKAPTSPQDVSENLYFYPPGRIKHIVSVVSSEASDPGQDQPTEEQVHVGIYETQRDLYSKLRLSITMINDHYMPMYKKMIEQLIRELENEEEYICMM